MSDQTDPKTQPDLNKSAQGKTDNASEFRSHVQKLVEEGKLSEEDAASLLEDTEEPELEHTDVEVEIEPEKYSGKAPNNLDLHVDGYNLQVLIDPSVSEPILKASEEKKLTLKATEQGWRVSRVKGEFVFGWSNLRGVLTVPFEPIDVKAVVGGGNLKLPSVSGVVRAKVGGGNLDMQEAAQLSTSIGGGNLYAGHIAGQADVSMGGGNAKIASAQGLSGSLAGGNLKCHLNLQQGEHHFSLAGGNMKLLLDPNSNVAITAQSTAGNVKSDFPMEKTGQFVTHTHTTTLGEGEASLNIKLAAGSLALLQKSTSS